MRSITTAIAAIALLVTGAVGGAALTAAPDRAAAPARPAAPAPVEVRTQVIHRTVHVARHIKRKHRAAPPPPTPAVLPARPQPVVASVARPAPRVTRPLRTRSSATGGAGEDRGEREGGENEGGADD